MRVSTRRLPLTKRHPLTISRGTITGSVNAIAEIDHDGSQGLGEMAPGGDPGDDAARAEDHLHRWATLLADVAPHELQRVDDLLAGDEAGPSDAGWSSARAALDIALHDWVGRRLGVPLWRLWGLDVSRIAVTSLTIGINAPEVVRERVPEVLARTGARSLKVKLGSPAGEAADRDMFAAAQEAAARYVAASDAPAPAWRVDANGGWSVPVALRMCGWLAERGVDCIEQPLARGADADLAAFRASAGGHVLPVYLDESIRVAADVARLAPLTDGVNLKLMKCGGLREAIRVVHTARAHGLGVMIGCMGESTLAITAAAHLSPLADHVDLDSHLNLLDDPFLGAELVDGRILPGDGPGHGVRLA